MLQDLESWQFPHQNPKFPDINMGGGGANVHNCYLISETSRGVPWDGVFQNGTPLSRSKILLQRSATISSPLFS